MALPTEPVPQSTGPDGASPPHRAPPASLASARKAVRHVWQALREVEPAFWRNLHTELTANIVLAGLVALSAFGNQSCFGRLPVQQLSWARLRSGLLVTLVAGMAGGHCSRA